MQFSDHKKQMTIVYSCLFICFCLVYICDVNGEGNRLASNYFGHFWRKRAHIVTTFFYSSRLGLIPSRVKPMTLKLLFTALLPYLTLSVKVTVWRTSRQVYLFAVRKGFSHLSLMDRWPATPKRARSCALVAFSWQDDIHVTKQRNFL